MRKSKTLAWTILIILSVIWGSSFVLMKRGLEVFSSGQVAALRVGIAFVVLAPFLIRYYQLDFKKFALPLLAMGLFGNFIPAFLFTKAETGISSSLAGMLNALTPIFTILMGIAIFKHKSQASQMSGVVLGFIGAIMLLSFNPQGSQGNNISYALLVVLATLSYAISVNTIKKYLGSLPAVTAAVWAFTFIGPVALIYLFNTNFIDLVRATPSRASVALAYIAVLGILGTAISVMLFNVLVRISDAVFASSCTYLIPIVAILWGMLEGDRIHYLQYVAMGVIMVSIWLMNKKKS